MLKLTAKTDNETLILNHLTLNASPQLKDKINAGTKTLAQCWSYIVSEARKMATGNCACIDKDTVFGWAIHFFEEDSIGAEAPSKRVETVKAEVKKVEKKPKEDTEQISLFDVLGG